MSPRWSRATARPRPDGCRPTTTASSSCRPSSPSRVAPSGAGLLIAGFGALGLAVAAVFVFYNGRSAIERPDAARTQASQQGIDDAAPADDGAPADAAAPLADAPEPADGGAPVD